MIKRLFKAISLPIAIFILLIPMIVIQGLFWVLNGKKTPIKVMEEYFEWLEK